MKLGRRFFWPAIIALSAVLLAALPLGAAPAAGAPAVGTVTVAFDFAPIPSIASNQMAVWIEDSQGKFVKTLFVTRFTGKGGYERRPECLPLWRAAAGLEGPPTAAVDAVTGATPQPGRHSLVWDCTDREGKAVPAGKYVYKVEGTLFWTKEVLWTGEITVGAAADQSRAAARCLPDDDYDGGQTIANVAAAFTPAEARSQ